jgi:CelD/BcsL family acetyltransferase involved in cellulose biosynthesis
VDYLRGEESFKFEFANDVVRLNSYIEAATTFGRASLGLQGLWQSTRRLVPSQGAEKSRNRQCLYHEGGQRA